MQAFQVLLYYCFTRLDDPEGFAEEHRLLCESLELRGRILIATEGINGTVSGTVASCEAYQLALQTDPRFQSIEFKIDHADGHVFRAMHIRVREEIITLGIPLESRVEERSGVHLSPPEWLDMLDQDDVVILDGRNHYESMMGHFEGAICPEVGSFRELPEWIDAHRDLFEGKKVLTYCTGGIRCEKLTTYMLEAGFSDVFQLRGGIVEYGKHAETQGAKFLGVNLVFDSRVVVEVGPKSTQLTVCEHCGIPTHNLTNCFNVSCNCRMILCAACEQACQGCCSDACRNSTRRRKKNQKLSETYVSAAAG